VVRRDFWSYSYSQHVPSCGEIRGTFKFHCPQNALASYSWAGPELMCSHKWSSRWWCEFFEEGCKEWLPLATRTRGDVTSSWLGRGKRRDLHISTECNYQDVQFSTYKLVRVPSIPTIRELYSPACAIKCWRKRGEGMRCCKRRSCGWCVQSAMNSAGRPGCLCLCCETRFISPRQNSMSDSQRNEF